MSNPNITATDKDGNELTDRQIEINGIVPGEGSGDEGYFVLNDGTLLPVTDVDVVDLSGVTVDASEFAETAADVDAIPTAEKGDANGVATLDPSGDLPGSQLPQLAITETYTIDTESQLTDQTQADQGDVSVVNEDGSGSFILAEDDPTVRENWTELEAREPPVSSVHGRTGDVTAQVGDYDLPQIGNVDVSALLEGNITDRPASGDVPTGARYHALDQDLIYRNASNGWRVTHGRGTADSPVPEGHYESLNAGSANISGQLTTRTTNDDFAIDATAHDTIQNALDHADSNDIAVIKAPPRTYSGPVTIPRGLSLRGASADTSDPSMVDYEGAETSVSGGRQMRLEGIFCRNTGDGLCLEITDESTIFNCALAVGGTEIIGNGNFVFANWFNGEDLVIEGDNNVVFGNTEIGSVTDNGLGNEVFGNT